MPQAPKTLCHCGGFKTNGKCNRCNTYRGKHQQTTKERGYGHDWRKFREMMLANGEAICRDCQAEGLVTPSVELHHKIKIRDRPDLRLEPTNVMGLCLRHHQIRSARGE